MNVASIDIGSNTVLLLIASVSLKDREFEPILNKYRIPRISTNLVRTGNISTEGYLSVEVCSLEFGIPFHPHFNVALHRRHGQFRG